MGWVGLLIAALLQPTPPPIRCGSDSQRLTQAELAQIERFAADAGGRVWLIIDGFSGVPGGFRIYVYLYPDEASGRLRRGRGLTIGSFLPPDQAVRSGWRVSNAFSYTHILPSDTRAPAVGPECENRPFGLRGNMSDKDLLSLVAFLRSDRRFSELRGNRRYGLSSVDATGEALVVWFSSPGSSASQRLTLTRRFGRWRIKEWSSIIV
jgi:hypothetical protein